MLLSVENSIRDFSQLVLKTLFQDDTFQEVFLGPSHFLMDEFSTPDVRNHKVVAGMNLGSLSDQTWFTKSSQEHSSDQGKTQPCQVEGSKTNKEQVRGLNEELRVHEHLRKLTSSHVESCDNVLSLSLSSVFFGSLK